MKFDVERHSRIDYHKFHPSHKLFYSNVDVLNVIKMC